MTEGCAGPAPGSAPAEYPHVGNWATPAVVASLPPRWLPGCRNRFDRPLREPKSCRLPPELAAIAPGRDGFRPNGMLN